ncbi:hypothetical protein JQ615_24745 [Bradyrhizobium jicamae]|uniref:SMODS and SLOG-associating 2TM effector domain-containing protein n=1 Tax=Bradyrhizobium jicamae TaxID=280332 RepID=A0ABS5FP75_9BRAD|nr:hypothetical protein [Bradyrhizobium jicamae]MBR0798602.1 hypothetical protein [Bradyrhizobium jicamae]
MTDTATTSAPTASPAPPAAQPNLASMRSQLRFIYDSYRTALFNRKYYASRLSQYSNYNFWLEVTVAAGATGGGIASFAIWKSAPGQYAWLAISGLATVLGVMKPFLKFGEKIERYSKLFAGHGGAFWQLKSIVESIEVQQAVPPKIIEQYEVIKKKLEDLDAADDPQPDPTTLVRLQAEVNKEIPAQQLWMP